MTALAMLQAFAEAFNAKHAQMQTVQASQITILREKCRAQLIELPDLLPFPLDFSFLSLDTFPISFSI